MRDGVKVAGTVLAMLLLGSNAALLIDWRFGDLEESGLPSVQYAPPQKGKERQTAGREQAGGDAVPPPRPFRTISSESESQQSKGATEPRRANKEHDGPYIVAWRWLVRFAAVVFNGTHFTDWAIAFAGVASAVAAAFQYRVYREQAGIMSGQLKAAVDAAGATEKAANASSKSAVIAERMAIGLERPFVFVEGFKINFLSAVSHGQLVVSLGGDKVKMGAYARFLLRNYGRAPAIITEARFGLLYSSKPPKEEDFLQETVLSTQIILGPDQLTDELATKQIQDIYCRGAGREGFVVDRQYLFFCGYVTVSDLMGNIYIRRVTYNVVKSTSIVPWPGHQYNGEDRYSADALPKQLPL